MKAGRALCSVGIRSDEELPLETSASESLYGGQFTLSTQLIKPNYLGNFYSHWRTIKHGFPHGAILGPPVLVGLDFLTGWNVLISFAIRLLMNLAKSTPYGDLIRRNIADTCKP